MSTASQPLNPAGHKYPTRAEIFTLFEHLGKAEYDEFFARVDEGVDWTIMGTSPMSRQYASLADFRAATLARLGKILKPPGLLMKVRHVVGGGDDAWATVEMRADAECENGQGYNMVYAWVVRFDERGIIVQVRAYIDTALLERTLRENECPSTRADINF